MDSMPQFEKLEDLNSTYAMVGEELQSSLILSIQFDGMA
jgi:hypothetical protein